MSLGRSGQYASLCCLNGVHGKKGCTARGFKAVRIVEEAILEHIRRVLFTPDFLNRLVEAANRHLAAEATRPREDVEARKSEIRETKRRLERLGSILAREGEAGLNTLVQKVRGDERRLDELRAALAEVEARDAPPLPPMSEAVVNALLDDLRPLLARDIPATATILRELTGPVFVDQVQERGKPRRFGWRGSSSTQPRPSSPCLPRGIVQRGALWST